ncbi:MAG: response regulator transcription factor [Oligoflexia bacterium]|nr:response regulator transcription factor [Oligoflexia bacterium]
MIECMIVEDDKTLGDSLKKYLEGEGYKVSWCESLAVAKNEDVKKFEFIILDWMLPDGQGIDFLREVRGKDQNIPVIMLTARTEVVDKVLGLESGANDYITKPFEPRELMARIRVQLRNKSSSTEESHEKITLGELVIDDTQRKIYFEGVEKEFTKMEYEFLKLLAESPNRAFSREEILNKVWGYENYPSTRTVDTHVLQIRQKLYDELIETVRGVGYRLKWDS